MSIRHFDTLFKPNSVAVIGASNRPHSIGQVVMRNLLQSGFGGAILPVHPKERSVAGVLAYNEVAALPVAPDLAVICTPPATVPSLIQALGARGTKAAVIITAGLSGIRDENGVSLQSKVLEFAKPHTLRILGPNCVGILLPNVGLNASFAHVDALPGRIAFVSQSGALCTSVLDWARSNDIGFSCFVSLGDCADIDFGDTLDYLGGDSDTHSILLYMESIGADEARKFMSAARAAARNKPVIVVKSGRMPEGAKAAASHTGALAGSDDVYGAALRRAGMLRVFEISELFDAVETLARAKPIRGDRLAIVTNGGGPGVLATDALVAGQGAMAELSPQTINALNRILPPTWSQGNPVDLIGDAAGQRYADALEPVLKDPGVDAVLVLNVPTAIASSLDAAQHVVKAVANTHKPVLTSWMGKDAVERSRDVLREARIPTYETPYDGVRAFLQMVEFRRNQESLMQVPPSSGRKSGPDHDLVRRIVDRALSDKVDMLSELDAKQVLAAYGVNVVETRIAADAKEAVEVADAIGYPVALKILSPQITHKSDVGGVALNIENEQQLVGAAKAMRARAQKKRPDADLQGFTVQQMVRRPDAHELIIGMSTDRIFGPVMLFGHGGTAVEVIADRAMGLPPLNEPLAMDMINATRVARLLRGYRDRPAADIKAICQTLIRVTQLVTDVPEISELDINPLLADQSGVITLDARIRICPPTRMGTRRLAIRPYPSKLEEEIELPDGLRLVARPIRPDDEPSHAVFISKLSKTDIRNRFFGVIRELPHSQMARLTQIDYDREMAFIATTSADEDRETLGVVRVVFDPDNITAEFAIITRSDFKRRGLGRLLMAKMIDYCRRRGTQIMIGEVLADNRPMLDFMDALGFDMRMTHDGTMKVSYMLQQSEKTPGSTSPLPAAASE